MAAKEGRELVKEAVKDAQALKSAAFDAAKNQLVEQMAPGVRALLEKTIRSALGTESVDRVNAQGSDHYSPASREREKKFQENKGDDKMADKDADKEKELDLESLSGFFPQLSEDPGDDDEQGIENPDLGMHLSGQHGEEGMPQAPEASSDHNMEEAECPHCGHELAPAGEEQPEDEGMSIPQLGESEDPEADMKEGKDKEKEDMDEEVEISESELHKVYEAALQTEAQVSKGFKEMTAMGELEHVHKDVGKGIADVKSGEKPWEKEVPPDHVDYQIKETIARGLAENKMLRGKLKEAFALIKKLGTTLHETNLFNSKVLHVNRILNGNVRLTKEQKTVVLESIDKAKSVAQVKMVYEAIVSSFKASAGSLTESKARKPAGNAQRARTTGTPNPKVLSESVDRAQGQGQYTRLQQLAGLLK